YASVVLRHTCWSQGRSIMKHALIAIAGVGILAATVGVETANAQYSSPPPPSYAPPPAYSPAPSYVPAPRYPSSLPSIRPPNLQRSYRARLHPRLWSAAL